VAVRDNSTLIGLAVHLASRNPCPMCEAMSWKVIDFEFEIPVSDFPAAALLVPVACGDCGFTNLFMRTYLESRLRTQLDSDRH
jgi:hypothetical protein